MTTPVILHRVDPERNMERFYRMQMKPTLFGSVTLIRVHKAREGRKRAAERRRLERDKDRKGSEQKL